MKKAFTLIELLVVIAIIAILAAILFPVFAQAKAAAKKTQALSNMKQTGTGVLIYMNDTDGMWPMGTGIQWFYPLDGAWSWDAQPYIKNLPILRDPTDPLQKTNGYNWQTWFDPNAAVQISFASNGLVKWNGTDNEMAGLMGGSQGRDLNGTMTRFGPYTGGWYAGPSIVNESSVNRVSDTIAFASRYSGNNQFGMGDVLTNVTGWDYTGANAIPDGTRNGTPYTITSGSSTIVVNKDNRYGAVNAAYANKAVFVFADSHAKTMDPVQTNPSMQNLDDQDIKNMWNARRPN